MGKIDLVRFADAQDRSVVKQDFERVHVVRGARTATIKLCHYRMHAAGIVAEHAANRAVIVRGRVGSKNETELFDFLLQFIQDKTRLDPRQLALHVNLEHAIHVLREINDHRNVAALSRQARPAAATGDRRAELAAGRDGGYDIAAVARDHHTDRNLAIIRAVGRIKSAVPIAEAHFATDSGAQCALERAGINLSDVRQRDIFLHQRVSTPDPCRAATDQALNAR